jgi:AcrR family transcriptional regulator
MSIRISGAVYIMSDQAPTIQWVIPQQPRSQETLERLAQATIQLLEKKSFEQISIEEIAKQAGSSVGGFYARFPDKEALYAYLYAQYEAELEATTTKMFEPTRWHDVPLRQRVEAICTLGLTVFRQREGFFRTMVLRTHINRTPLALEQASRRGKKIKSIRKLLLECRGEMNHSNPDLATEIGFFQMMMAIQERVLFPHSAHSNTMNVPDDVFLRELVNAFVAYVGASSLPSSETNHVAYRT